MAQDIHIYEKIKARRLEIEQLRLAVAQRIEAACQEQLALDQEDRELAITEKTVARFLPDRPEDAIGTLAGNIIAKLAPSVDRSVERTPRKPDGIPPITDMATAILAEAALRGQPWMDAPQITEEIRKRWWPNVEPGFIGPQLWRAAIKRNTFRKDGARYALPLPNIEKGSDALNPEPFHMNGTIEDHAARNDH